MCEEVGELGRLVRDVIDDQVGNDIVGPRDVLDTLPIAETWIHRLVVYRVEPGIGPVERSIERQQVDTGEHPIQRTRE